MTTNDQFFQAYDREEIAFGLRPSAELASYLSQITPTGFAVDLGAGPGRNAIALAQAGLRVLAVDLSRRGLDRLLDQAQSLNVDYRIETMVADVREVELVEGQVDVMVATTVLDHIPLEDAQTLWIRIERCLSDQGVVYAEVHTTEDPGCSSAPGRDNPYPVSETAGCVKHYFSSGELLRMATESSALRVLRYEERLEWDYTHGNEHHHGKAVLLAVRSGYYPQWYGHPIAFPRLTLS
jgi:cyclopropane fatty-acyl-phospholipid synthase-like methyltransferase